MKSLRQEWDEQRGIKKVDAGVSIAGQLADAATTIAVLAKPGRQREENPAMRSVVKDGEDAKNVALFVIVKAGIGVGAAAMGNVLAKNGHRKLGRGLAWVAGLVGFGAAAHNLKEIK